MAKKKNKMKWFDWVAYVLCTVGSINWGLRPLGINLVNLAFKSVPFIENTIYVLVGVAGVYCLATIKKLI